MNALLRLNPAPINLSADDTASRVHRFVSQRSSMLGRPEPYDRGAHAGPSMPLHVLYPTLYAKRLSTAQRCRRYFHSLALNLGNRFARRGDQAPPIASSAK